ncbi:hypothetical protein H7X46_20775 [Pseudonocardia sp. C8]|uniref:hypothetical protein n=1 Tax=Pseudonocardia sp. C8 TaxID=2762759 RepID=UPI001642E883|nr:hypothetical protein [Pseudonocardia sp. C8]MBC3193499.1 hypothetical protein [Pseudonocardia sp. C8]
MARSSLRQAHWGVLSQGLNAGTNFLLSFLVARSQPAAEFGRFALVLVLLILAVALVRETGNTVLTIAHSGDRDGLCRGGRQSTGYAAGVGTLAAACCLVAAVPVTGAMRAVLVVLAVVFPFVLLQDALRGVSVAAGRPRSAAGLDALWAGVQIGLTAVVMAVSTQPPMWTFVAAWGAGAVVSALAGLRRRRLVPARALPHRWLLRHRALTVPLLGAYALNTLPPQIVMLAMPLVSDFTETGVLRAAYLLFGPIATLFASVYALAMVDAVRAGTPAATVRVAGFVSAALGGIGALWCVLAVLLPSSAGRLLMGSTWELTGSTRLLLGISLVAEGVVYGAMTAMGALRRPGRMVRARLVAAPVLLVLALAGGALAGAEGAAAGLLSGHALCAALAWAQVPGAARQADRDDAAGVAAGTDEPAGRAGPLPER